MVVRCFFDYRPADFWRQQICDSQPTTGHLVLISWPYSTACGSDCLAPERFLSGLIDRNMVRQNNRAQSADVKPGLQLHAYISQLINLVQQGGRRYHDSVADEAAYVVPQDSRWHKMKNRFLFANNEGMASIVASLKTNNRLGSIR